MTIQEEWNEYAEDKWHPNSAPYVDLSDLDNIKLDGNFDYNSIYKLYMILSRDKLKGIYISPAVFKEVTDWKPCA